MRTEQSRSATMKISPLFLLAALLCAIVARNVRQVQGYPHDGSSTVSPGDNAGDDRKPGCPCARNDTAAAPLIPGLQWPGHPPEQSFTRNIVVHGMACACNLALKSAPIRDDYRYTPGIGSHKLHTRATVWNEARKLCNEEGGHLAIVNSFAEAHVLLDIFNRSGPIKGATYADEALLGIHDLYAEGEWVTVLGDSLAKTGYTGWSDKWGGQPDNGGGRQHCGALLKEGGIDDVACDVPFPFFCELPTMQFIQ